MDAACLLTRTLSWFLRRWIAMRPVSTLMVLAGCRGRAPALEYSISPLRASMMTTLRAEIRLLILRAYRPNNSRPEKLPNALSGRRLTWLILPGAPSVTGAGVLVLGGLWKFVGRTFDCVRGLAPWRAGLLDEKLG